MNSNSSTQWIPIATTEAGRCLTWQNWEDCGIDTLVFYLDALLMKPGAEILNTFDSLRDYTGWYGKHVLNVCSIGKNKNGALHLKSSFDGSDFTITHEDLCALIVHLSPDEVIVPIWLEDAWMSTSSKERIVASFAKQSGVFRAEHDASLCYVVDSADKIEWPIQQTPVRFESDKPAFDAQAARIYTQEGVVNLLDPIHEHAFIPLDSNCTCSVCATGLTRAYLHHLIQHTPLLAYRFLIIHNGYCNRCRQ